MFFTPVFDSVQREVPVQGKRGPCSGGSLSGGGVLCPGGRGVSVQGVLCPGRVSVQGVYVRGGLCQGDSPHHTVMCRRYTSYWNAFLVYECSIFHW